MDKAIVGTPGDNWRIGDQVKITSHLQLDKERDQVSALFARVSIPRGQSESSEREHTFLIGGSD